MKKLLIFFSLLLVSAWANAQCECINQLVNATENINVLFPEVSGGYVNRSSVNYWLDLEDGKHYRIIMRHQTGDLICSNPNMVVQNTNAGSNNYSYDFVFDGTSSWTNFAFSWVFYSDVQPGESESFEFEVRKRIGLIYYEQHTFNLTINATCVESYSGTPSQNLAHGLADYEVNDYISLTAPASNYYSDGVINFDAGNYINFGPGFATDAGTYEAFIDGCNGLKSGPVDNVPAKNPLSDLNEMGTDQVKIYPNPFDDYITVAFDKSEQRTISIMDESGRVLNNYQVLESDNIQINLSDLIHGVYFMKITFENGTSEVKRIVRN